MTTAYLSLGSNIDRQHNLCACLAALRGQFGPLRVSTVYRCPAVGFEGGDFYNLAVALEASSAPEALDQSLKSIETALGRRRDAPKFSDRCIDIDLLIYGDHTGHFGTLELPRPDILEYAFVLAPLAELAPATVHPHAGRPLAELWAQMAAGGHELTAVELRC